MVTASSIYPIRQSLCRDLNIRLEKELNGFAALGHLTFSRVFRIWIRVSLVSSLDMRVYFTMSFDLLDS